MADWDSLLNKQADEIKPPELAPVGTYILVVDGYETTESSVKGTPGIQFTYKVIDALDDIDPEELQGVDLNKVKIRDTQWLTEDSTYRLIELFKKMGLNTSGRTINELLPDSKGAQIQAMIVQKPSNDGRTFNNISNIEAVE